MELQLAILRDDFDAVAAALLAGAHTAEVEAPTGRRRTRRILVQEADVLMLREDLAAQFADVHLLSHLDLSSPLAVLAVLAPQDDAVLSLLLAARALDVTSRDDNGLSCLHWIAQRTAGVDVLLPLARALVSAGAELESREEMYGASPLAWSGWHGCPGAAAAFLALGAQRESRDAFMGTPLGWAVQNGHTAAAAVLKETQRGVPTAVDPEKYRLTLQTRHAERLEAGARAETAWALHLVNAAMEESTAWTMPGPARVVLARLLMAHRFTLWPPRTRPL